MDVMEMLEGRIKDACTRIPDYMHSGVLDYVLYGRRTGSFLEAVISNQLVEAFTRADQNNMRLMSAYAQLLMYFPADSWGSPEAYREWMERGGMKGILAAREEQQA